MAKHINLFKKKNEREIASTIIRELLSHRIGVKEWRLSLNYIILNRAFDHIIKKANINNTLAIEVVGSMNKNIKDVVRHFETKYCTLEHVTLRSGAL